MEIYKEWAPDSCLGCGASIMAGDIVLPVERGWLLCIECAEDYLSGRPLAAWSAGSDDGQALDA